MGKHFTRIGHILYCLNRNKSLKVQRMVSIATGFTSKLSLNDGKAMPLFGLGVFKTSDTEQVALQAIKQGYRMLDTAEFYQNEEMVGNAVRKSGVPREELFVVTKLLKHGVEACKSHFKTSFEKLNIGYIDLYLIHTPVGGEIEETYKTMMDFQRQGMVRSIGVSNFGVHHLEALAKAGLPAPAVNQIELHPWQQHRDIVKYCREKGIAVMGYSPMSKGQRFDDEQLIAIAKRNQKTPGQVLIRWSVQNGFITIPKTSTPGRLAENADVFDWIIPDEDMKILNDVPQRSCMPARAFQS